MIPIQKMILTFFIFCKALTIQDPAIDSYACADKLKKYLDIPNSKYQWESNFSETDAKTFKSHTEEIGTWIFLGQSDHMSTIAKVTRHSQIVVQWKAPGCEAKESLRVLPDRPRKLEEKKFTDLDLEKLVKSKKAGLILVWSPQMPISIESLETAKKAAQAKGIAFTVILDSNADLNESRKIIKKENFPDSFLLRNDSQELMLRNLEIHFPTVIAYSKGHLADHILPGFSLESLYEQYIEENILP